MQICLRWLVWVWVECSKQGPSPIEASSWLCFLRPTGCVSGSFSDRRCQGFGPIFTALALGDGAALRLGDIAEVWRRGSVIGAWLLDLTGGALLRDPQLQAYGGRVSDSGEGRWTLQAAIDEAVPAHVLSAALYQRFASRGEAGFANQVLSAMRHEFGGHAEKPTGDST